MPCIEREDSGPWLVPFGRPVSGRIPTSCVLLDNKSSSELSLFTFGVSVGVLGDTVDVQDAGVAGDVNDDLP